VNYYVAVIYFLQWIVRSAAGVVACGGRVLSADEERRLSKTLDEWQRIREPLYSQAKSDAQRNNTLEQMQASNHWTSVVAIRRALDQAILPSLRAMTEQKELRTHREQLQYFEMLMFAIMVYRPCRPSTYYAAYVMIAAVQCAACARAPARVCTRPHASARTCTRQHVVRLHAHAVLIQCTV
jgi:hypothetical protein